MRNSAVDFYDKGYNCSQCIIKACERDFSIPVSKQCFKMLSGITGGFGIGGICSCLVAGVMCFSLFFDDDTVKKLRIELFDRINERFGNINCGALSRFKGKNGDCAAIIGDCWIVIYELIEKQRGQR